MSLLRWLLLLNLLSFSLTQTRVLSATLASSIHLPFVLKNPKTPQSQPAVPVPLGSNEVDKIEMFWKWGHIWVRRSSSCVCHFICITPRRWFIHIGLYHTQFHITIGFFFLPAMTNSMPRIHVDNPCRRLVHPAISYSGSTVYLLTPRGWLFVFYNRRHLCGASHQAVHTSHRIRQTVQMRITVQSQFISAWLHLRESFTICPSSVQCSVKKKVFLFMLPDTLISDS